MTATEQNPNVETIEEAISRDVLMKTVIQSCLTGAERSSGVVVVIDVFRASNTILMLLSRGAASLMPVASVEEAFDLKKKYPDYLLAGERKGIKINRFDMGNSPHEVYKKDVDGKHVIFTTSAGTQGMVRAARAERVLVGSFGNAGALTRMLSETNPHIVTWLAVGTEGLRKAIEDEACALYLQGKLKGESHDVSLAVREIMKGEGAQRLKKLGQENDFPYCLGVDIFDFVPEVKRVDDRLRIFSDLGG